MLNRNTKRALTLAAIPAIILAGAGVSLAAAATTSTPKVLTACVNRKTHAMTDRSASKCPAGTFSMSWNQKGPAGPTGQTGATGQAGPQGPSGVVTTETVTGSQLSGFTSQKPVATGGHFTTNKTDLGSIPVKAGQTYLVSVNADAEPNADTSSSAGVFPQFFVYDSAAKPDFSNDLFNIGSGALDIGTNHDSWYSGSSVIDPTTDSLEIYAFGYDGDGGGSSYNLTGITVTLTQINPAS
jgi:hypothetical protein